MNSSKWHDTQPNIKIKYISISCQWTIQTLNSKNISIYSRIKINKILKIDLQKNCMSYTKNL